jgi:hypothetical protein
MTYENAVFRITSACGCGCNGVQCLSIHGCGKSKTCLTFLFYTIFTVARMRTCIAEDANLMPTQSGLYHIY